MLPWVLPAHQRGAVLLRSVHQLFRNVSRPSQWHYRRILHLSFLVSRLLESTHEKPHAGTQRRGSKPVHERHVRDRRLVVKVHGEVFKGLAGQAAVRESRRSCGREENRVSLWGSG